MSAAYAIWHEVVSEGNLWWVTLLYLVYLTWAVTRNYGLMHERFNLVCMEILGFILYWGLSYLALSSGWCVEEFIFLVKAYIIIEGSFLLFLYIFVFP